VTITIRQVTIDDPPLPARAAYLAWLRTQASKLKPGQCFDCPLSEEDVHKLSQCKDNRGLFSWKMRLICQRINSNIRNWKLPLLAQIKQPKQPGEEPGIIVRHRQSSIKKGKSQ
jgi:hypothetical protein